MNAPQTQLAGASSHVHRFLRNRNLCFSCFIAHLGDGKSAISDLELAYSAQALEMGGLGVSIGPHKSNNPLSRIHSVFLLY